AASLAAVAVATAAFAPARSAVCLPAPLALSPAPAIADERYSQACAAVRSAGFLRESIFSVPPAVAGAGGWVVDSTQRAQGRQKANVPVNSRALSDVDSATS